MCFGERAAVESAGARAAIEPPAEAPARKRKREGKTGNWSPPPASLQFLPSRMLNRFIPKGAKVPGKKMRPTLTMEEVQAWTEEDIMNM